MRADKMLFYIFIFLLPWQTRFIFTPEKSEFLSFSIYLSEIFLWLALAFWLTSVDLKKIPSNPPFKKGGMGGIFLFSFFVFLSVLWSSDRVAAFRLWLFIFDGIMVYLFLRENENMRRGTAKIFLFSLFVAALFGIWQFFNLGSPAWKWLGLAERGAWNLGDIVVAFGGERWLRAYGPFPHPNIFGGYLAAGLIILFNLIKNVTQSIRSYRLCYYYFLGGFFLFALFLTFSRSAWVALAIAAIYSIFKNFKNVHLSKSITVVIDFDKTNTVNKKDFLNFFVFLFLLAIALSIIFWPFVRTRVPLEAIFFRPLTGRAESSGRLEQKSNIERVASWRDGLAVWRQNPFFGSGIGNYNHSVIPDPDPVLRYGGGNYSGIQKLNNWIPDQVRNDSKSAQPAHNIFLMALAELGLVGFAIYLFIWRGFWKNPIVRPLLILFFIIGLFDHYLWTLYSGQMLFWLGFAMQPDV